MEKIQEILFENKEKIPDGLYLELMNNLNIDAGKYYKVEYQTISPHLFFDNNDCDINLNFTNTYRYGEQEYHETIISCENPKLTENYKKLLNAGKPFWSSNMAGLFPCGHQRLHVRHNTLIRENKNDEDYDDDENIDGEDCRNIHITTDFDVSYIYFIVSVKKC